MQLYVYVLTNNVNFIAKPIMLNSSKTIIKESKRINSNVMLTCVHYAYPTAEITWNITTESSSVYRLVRENSTGNYILHNNGDLEVYHRYIFEEDHVTAVCTAANKYGAAQTVFHLWNHEKFYQGVLNILTVLYIHMCMHLHAEQLFILYTKVCSCQDLKYVSGYL